MPKPSNFRSKEKFSFKSIMDYKEDDNSIIVGGYIATTHFDGEDVIQVETLESWANEINEGNPRANKVSVNHDRQPHVAGVGVKGSARIDELPDGEKGLYVDTLVDRTRSDYDDIKYRLDNDLLDSFSIEYSPPMNPEFNEASGARMLDASTVLHGWTLASQPMNEHAVRIKELIQNSEQLEVNKMTEQEVKSKETVIEKKEVLSKEDQDLLVEAKEMKKKELLKDEIMKVLKDETLQKEISEVGADDKVLKNKEEGEDEEDEKEDTPEEKEAKELAESIEYKEYSQIFEKESEVAVEEKFRRAGILAEKTGMVYLDGVDSLGYKTSKAYTPKQGDVPKTKFKSFGTNGTKLEFKSLGITTNQNTDTDYLLSSAELRDVFDPVIYDVLNQSVLTWGLLRKDDFSNKGNNQVQFVLRNGANPTAAFYTGNSVSLDNSDLIKLQTKFKKVQAGVSVDGDMVAAARGGQVGDVFATHVRFATEDMLSVVNSALFAEVGLETAAAVIGFEYITDSAGNTTMYNMVRSTVTGLAPTTATDTYINGSSARISLDNLRKAIQNAIVEGASLNNLVFITHPTQERLFKGIYDATQRTMPTSSKFGFEGRPEFDGVAIFADKDCNSDDWFLVDLDSHRAGVWVPPTLEMLGKRSDSEEGFIKMYFATYNTSPNRMVQIYGNATS